MSTLISQSQLFFQDENTRPLGRLTLAGTLKKVGNESSKDDGSGMRHKMRVFGRYALVLVVAGAGFYRDALGAKSSIAAGDAILVFPELAHSYGPRVGQSWEEIYLCFDGPIFDLWRSEQLLSVAHPVHTVSQLHERFAALRQLAQSPRPSSVSEHVQQINQFLAILAAVVALPDPHNVAEKTWLQRAKAVLEANLGTPTSAAEAARAAGLSYDHFRKAFAHETGVSPVRYRDLKRVEAAKVLLGRHDMTNAVVARSLGFRDESHFSHRFKQLVGQSPRQYRSHRIAIENQLK